MPHSQEESTDYPEPPGTLAAGRFRPTAITARDPGTVSRAKT